MQKESFVMKVILIHGKYFNSWEALGLGYIASYLRAKTNDVDLRFYQGCFDDDDEVVSGCEGADIVAFSCTSPTFPYAMRMARLVKEGNANVRVVVGGYHPSAIPQACMVDGIDQVVVGEGEDAMLQIVKGNKDPKVYGRPMDFDELPWPDRKLIKNERNIEVAFSDTGKRITSFQSHRGCPFMCRYCLDGFNKVLYRNVNKAPVRFRPVGDLLNEMEAVAREYDLDLMKFCDPTWNTDIEWVVEFCKEKIRRRFDIPFYPNIHATLCTEEMLFLMAEAGCHEIAVGIESGSPKILKQIGKATTVETIRRCVKWAKAAGILVRGYFILGMPDETEEDLRLTESFAEELDLDEYGFTILCPYPGTQMYDPVVAHADVDWEATDEYSNDFWRTRHLTNEQLKAWQQRLTQKFRNKLTWHNVVLADSC